MKSDYSSDTPLAQWGQQVMSRGGARVGSTHAGYPAPGRRAAAFHRSDSTSGQEMTALEAHDRVIQPDPNADIPRHNFRSPCRLRT